MKTNNKLSMLILIILLGFASFVFAVPWSPQGHVDLKHYWNMTNLSYFEAFTMAGDLTGGGNNLINFLYDWVIHANSHEYLSFNKTHLQFNQTTLNATIDARAAGDNSSMLGYVDAQDTLVRTSINNNVTMVRGNIDDNYTLLHTEIDEANTTLRTYTDALVTSAVDNNITMVQGNIDDNYTLLHTEIDEANSTLLTYVTSFFVQFSNIVAAVGNWSADKKDYMNASAGVGWENLTNYPSACSTYYAVTAINDSTTCTYGIDIINWSDTSDKITIAGENITSGSIAKARVPNATHSDTSSLAYSYTETDPLAYKYDGLSGENITSGLVADARIASSIARDNEVVPVTGGTFTGDVSISGNLTQNTQYYHCFNASCGAYIYKNASSLVIKVN